VAQWRGGNGVTAAAGACILRAEEGTRPMSESPAGEHGLLQSYLERPGGEPPRAAAAAYHAALDAVAAGSPGIASAVVRELADQRHNLKLIASENFSSLAVQLAHGNLLTDKYAEGYPGHRFYAGCDNVDAIELEAADLARKLFGADHVYVQPHSGADANLVAFFSILAKTRSEERRVGKEGRC